jgi:hypothetical protein
MMTTNNQLMSMKIEFRDYEDHETTLIAQRREEQEDISTFNCVIEIYGTMYRDWEVAIPFIGAHHSIGGK